MKKVKVAIGNLSKMKLRVIDAYTAGSNAARSTFVQTHLATAETDLQAKVDKYEHFTRTRSLASAKGPTTATMVKEELQAYPKAAHLIASSLQVAGTIA